MTDPLGHTTVNTYDSDNRLTQTTDAQGNVTRYVYDTSGGNLERVIQIDDAGREIVPSRFVYDTNGRLIETVDLNDVSRYFAYDDDGNQTHSWSVWQDDPDSPSAFKTLVSVTAYDTEGRVTGSAQHTFDVAYTGTPADHAALLAALAGNTADWSTSTTYDALSRVIASTDRFGNESRTLYDARGNVIQSASRVKDESDTTVWIVSRTYYDTNGRAVASSDPFIVADNAGDPDLTPGHTSGGGGRITPDTHLRASQTVYDDLGRAKQSLRIEGLAALITLDPDPLNPGLSVTTYTELTDTDPSVTSSSQTFYDAAGRVDYTLSATGLKTQFHYDAAGRQEKVVIDPDNTFGLRAETVTTYDNAGRQQTVEDALDRFTQFEYDKLGRVTQTILQGDTPLDTTDDVTSLTEYDALGRRVAAIDPLGRRTVYDYDDQGRLKGVTLPEVTDAAGTGSTTGFAGYTYGYDIYGNQTSITDPNGHETTFTFDHLGRQLTRTLPLGQAGEVGHVPGGFVEQMIYDDTPGSQIVGDKSSSVGFGQLSRSIDFEGRVTQYLYDNTASGGGRLVEKRYFNNTTDFGNGTVARSVTYTYDAFGRQTEADDNAFTTATTYEYDAEGRQTQTVTPQGTINYEYDDLGRMSRTYTGSTDTRYTYDELSRLKTVTLLERKGSPVTADGNSVDWYGTSIDGETTTYEYDLVGNLDLVSHDWNDTVADYHYDALNRLELLEHIDTDADNNGVADDPEVRARFTYERLADGSRSKVIEEFDTTGDGTLDKSQTFEWTYDALNRLVEERFDEGNDGLSAGDYVTRYAFDLASNRTQAQKDAGNDGSQAFTADETTAYTYDANDRLTIEDGPSDYTTYGYDNTVQNRKTAWTDDTETTKVSETTFSYDAMGRMIQVAIDSDGDGNVDSTQTYEYDHRSLRVTEDDGTTKTTYLFDAQNHTGYAQVLEQGVDANGNGLEAGEIDRTFTLGHDVITQAATGVASGAPLLLAYDGHGSTRAMIDALGQLIAAAENDASQNVFVLNYDAYGQALNFVMNNNLATNLLYSGEATNAATGLQYLRARWYDPSSGRFNRADDFSGYLQDPQSLHKYLYTHGNPIMGIDPSGLFTLKSLLGTVSLKSFLIHRLVDAGVGAVTNVAAGIIINGEKSLGDIFFNAATGAGLGLVSGGTVAAFNNVGRVLAVNLVKQIGWRIAIRMTLTFSGYGASAMFETLYAAWEIKRASGSYPTKSEFWDIYKVNLAVSFFAGFLPDAGVQAVKTKSVQILDDVARHRATRDGKGWPHYLNQMTRNERDLNLYLARFFASIDDSLPFQIGQIGLDFFGGVSQTELMRELDLDDA